MDRQKQYERSLELDFAEYQNGKLTRTEQAIIDLERILLSINPYSRWWRYGYIKSLRLAIKALRITTKEE